MRDARTDESEPYQPCASRADDSTRLSSLKSALDELGYTPVEGAEHYQFRKDDPDGFIERGIILDLLTAKIA